MCALERLASGYLRLQVPAGGINIQPLRDGHICSTAAGAAADMEADALLTLICQSHSPTRLLYLHVHLGAGSEIFLAVHITKSEQ